MLNKIKIYLILLVFVLITSCNETKKIIVHSCPGSPEANADILRSIDKKSDLFKKNNIEVIVKDDKCGYTLISKNKKRFIYGSMTGIDLLLEIESFYDLK